MRSRLAFLAVALALVVCAPALAASPGRLAAQVTDQAGVLDGRIAEIANALDALLADHDIQLFVDFVDTTAGLTATEFADETARASSLGGNDALLVVAMQDRSDAMWVSSLVGQRISDSELNAIIADTLEPRLRQGDYAGAAIATAEAMGAAAGGQGGAATAKPGDEAPTGAAPSSGVVPAGPTSIDTGPLVGAVTAALALILVAIGIGLLALYLQRRRAVTLDAEERDRRTGELARQANTGLVGMDDRIRSADQEAGFVEAEFGEDEAKPFHAAVAAARDELRAAFGVRQKLDDEIPEDAATREAMLREIVDRCGRAAAALDAQAARIKQLRDLEQHAPQILASLDAPLTAQDERIAGAESALASLAGYAESATISVKGNVAEARKGIEGARAAIARARKALEVGNARAAAQGIATAQAGIAGAKTLLDAVDATVAAIHDADTRLADELAAAKQDLDDAKAAAGPAGLDAAQVGHAADLASARKALEAATAAAAATARDPVAAFRLATTARHASTQVLAALRQDAAEQARLVAAIDAELAAARREIEHVQQFIATRSHGVGRQARTRLAAAQDALDRATGERETDPKAALTDARRAEQLAYEAYGLATDDFERFDAGRSGPGGGNAGADIGGAILGGIIGGILSGGMRGGGWGGSHWGGPFGGGGGGWGGGGHSVGGGGFGGFGGGGGGGHSVGGRW